MDKKKQKLSRLDFFKEIGQSLAQFVDAAFADELTAFADKFPELIRPPGRKDESDFLQRCIKCGKCIRACPFIALQPVIKAGEFDRGTPCLRLGTSFCRFCEDFPCVNACPTGALSKDGNLKKIGCAQALAKLCLRSSGNECTACAQICDRTFKAISYPGEAQAPSIDASLCSGCGACLTVCPVTPEPALVIRGD